MFIDVSISTRTISSLPSSLQILFSPLLDPPPFTNNSKPTPNPLQRRLRGLYEITLESATSLALARNNLSGTLSAFAVCLVPRTAYSAATNCFRSLIRSSRYVPKDSFRIALESARRLTELSIRLTDRNHQEKEQMDWYISKISILLRVMESYFYSPRSKHRCDLFGNPEQWNGRKGFPIAGVGVFEVREIGGALAGVVGVEILLKVGAMRPGIGADVLRAVERRMKVLKRCLVLMWERELAWIEKIRWLGSPARVVRRVKRQAGKAVGEGQGEKKENVGPTDASEAPDWEAQVSTRAFQTRKARKTSPDAKEMAKTPADDTLKRENNDFEVGKTPAARGGVRTTAPYDWEVHAARAFQTPRMEKIPTKEAGTPVSVDRPVEEAVMGETATEAVKAEAVQATAEAGGKKKKKKKKKKGGKKHGGSTK